MRVWIHAARMLLELCFHLGITVGKAVSDVVHAILCLDLPTGLFCRQTWAVKQPGCMQLFPSANWDFKVNQMDWVS